MTNLLKTLPLAYIGLGRNWGQYSWIILGGQEQPAGGSERTRQSKEDVTNQYYLVGSICRRISIEPELIF